jgi:DNA-binding transcriptional ArsR family regulator
MDTVEENESLEEKVFKSLGNAKRREIIRYLGERRARAYRI